MAGEWEAGQEDRRVAFVGWSERRDADAHVDNSCLLHCPLSLSLLSLSISGRVVTSLPLRHFKWSEAQCCRFRVPRPSSGSGSVPMRLREAHSAACDHPGHCLDRAKYNTCNTPNSTTNCSTVTWNGWHGLFHSPMHFFQ